MNLLEAIDKLKHPRNPYDSDLIALRVAILHLLERKDQVKQPEVNEVPPSEASEIIEEQPKKRGRKKNVQKIDI